MISDEMREFYDEMLKLIDAELVGEFNNKNIVVRLSCGHEKIYKKSGVYGFRAGQTPRCHECRMAKVSKK